ncbi:D-2-hydroxyacid dehydrogenase [Lachnospiraceae bacterium WCA-693-APC-MOT-I]|uniref:D-2-hydroxyacid dehydrogenase n=1 Tax=Velocimicrobium porci TaxID=2606634 RepID=A0A6L5XYX7_9FIRM|nr:D-2-hydroxyacid dehydrogenase [Velocimicrobium porci]
MVKIVFLETKTLGDDINLSKFNKLGKVVFYETSKEDEIAERVTGADVVVVNKLPMNQKTLGDKTTVKLICVTATGTNNIDYIYTREKKIAVTNVKGYSTPTVVQHTFALYFYLMEHLAYYDNYVKSGQYAESNLFTHLDRCFHDLQSMTWGIVGLGEIGRGVAAMAQAFGADVIYYSTSGKNKNQDFLQVEFDELLGRSDVVSVHAPLNENTKGLFGYEAFQKMKPSAYFLNLGRGHIVVEEDLARALNENLIAGAGLDVLCKEPMTSENSLLKVNNREKLIITPHIAWASVEARERLMEEVYKNIEAFQNGEKRNVIE